MIGNILRQIYLRPVPMKRLFHALAIVQTTLAPATPIHDRRRHAALRPSLLQQRRPHASTSHFLPTSDTSAAVVRFMSGHSKWQNIRHVKGANDAARSVLFSRLARLIQAAVKEGKSNDPKLNSQLAHVVDTAKKANMPIAKIENLLKEKETKDNMIKFTLEAKGPGGSFFILEGLTDNLKRTRQNVRTYMKKVGASLVDNGVMHSFIHKGVINVDPSVGDLTLESAVEVAIEVGAEDVKEDTDDDISVLQFLCEPVDFYAVKTKLLDKGLTLKRSELQYLPHTRVQLSDEQLNLMARFNDFLDEDPDIMKCYDNIQ